MSNSDFQFLRERADAGDPIRVGLVGVGQMGRGIVAQAVRLPGIEIAAVAEIDTQRAEVALKEAGSSTFAIVDDVDSGRRVLDDGGTAVTPDARILCELPVDVVVEATGMAEVGARVAFACAAQGKHIISMNVETDATIGRLLRLVFEDAGCVYTLAAGDEPSAAWDLYDFARTIGLEVVAAGKGKNNPLRRSAKPSDVADEAARKHMNPRMLAAFVDGTKTMCEMTVLSNATGFPPDVPGMHGPPANRDELAETFKPRDEGGILERVGVVDYVTGDVAPGVFVVVRTDDPVVAEDLSYLQVGPGPYWALVRPYHLANLEVPVSIVRLMRDGRPTFVSRFRSAEAVAVTKSSLTQGTPISGIGGDEMYGSIWPAEQAAAETFVPMGLAEGAVLRKDVAADTPLRFDDLDIEEDSTLARAWRLQEQVESGEIQPASIPWRELVT